jgi:hypothetical protein
VKAPTSAPEKPLTLPAPMSKPTPVIRASKGDVLVMVKVKVLDDISEVVKHAARLFASGRG